MPYAPKGVYDRAEQSMESHREGDAHHNHQYHQHHQRQYYLAVDRSAFKMGTLIDLLDILGRRSGLPIVLCCSSRDVLDSLCEAVSNLPYVSLSYLYSDMPEAKRASVIDAFRQVIANWLRRKELETTVSENNAAQNSCNVLVVTDACLPMQSSGETPFSSQILINFDLPTKKEAYLRRLTTCVSWPSLPSCKSSMLHIPLGIPVDPSHPYGPIVINMVVGGEINNLKLIEEGCNIIIEEMPINISELF